MSNQLHVARQSHERRIPLYQEVVFLSHHVHPKNQPLILAYDSCMVDLYFFETTPKGIIHVGQKARRYGAGERKLYRVRKGRHI